MEAKQPKCISHIRRSAEGIIEAFQSNEEHSQGVAELAKQFANEFGMGDFGYLMGILHDKGKEKKDFQEYIQDMNGISGHKEWSYEGKRHAYVGGLISKEMLPNFHPLIGNPIMGHHRGLYDWVDLEQEEKLAIPIEEGVTLPPNIESPALPSWFRPDMLKGRDFHHIERMLYSCLVDADFLDTERFMQPMQYAMRGSKSSLKDLLPRLNTYLAQFGEPTTEVNKIRCEIQKTCLNKASEAPGFYSLTVPTGGGKTLSSLVWAINHAIEHGKKRIIIAIPYTSIIVQTAGILREIFGEENVLEHHSNIAVDDGKEDKLTQKLKLATENWDYPIIVTTNVQLFESMMGNRSSECRKLHNICNSVLILDEVQTLPTDFLQPIVDSLETYQRIFGVSILFTTASQPVLSGKYQGTNPQVKFEGLSHIQEIINKDANLHNRLRRVALSIDNTSRSYDEMAERLTQHDRVLCIVNTRRDAKELFSRLPKEGVCIHLSRMMCPAHVAEQIQKMKEALEDPGNKVVRVISTQLIEAGVDIDFPVVYRQETGLDSILQAAGRCNREGKLPICTTYVFSLAQEHTLPRGFITQCNNARLNMKDTNDWFSPDAMHDYFLQLYSRIQSFDRKDMRHCLGNPRELMLETASREFQLIDDASTSVIVNWREGRALAEELKEKGPSYNLVKKISQYSVNVRKHDFDKMLKEDVVQPVIEGFYIVEYEKQYNDSVGLDLENHQLEETYII